MQPFLGDRSLLLLSRGLLFLLPPSPKSCLFAYVRVPSFLVCAQPFVRTCLDRSSVESRNFGKDEEADGRKRDWKERKKGKCITEIRLEWRERERLSGRPNCDKKRVRKGKTAHNTQQPEKRGMTFFFIYKKAAGLIPSPMDRTNGGLFPFNNLGGKE